MINIIGFLLATISVILVALLLMKHRKQNKLLKEEIERFKELNEES